MSGRLACGDLALCLCWWTFVCSACETMATCVFLYIPVGHGGKKVRILLHKKIKSVLPRCYSTSEPLLPPLTSCPGGDEPGCPQRVTLTKQFSGLFYSNLIITIWTAPAVGFFSLTGKCFCANEGRVLNISRHDKNYQSSLITATKWLRVCPGFLPSTTALAPHSLLFHAD